MTKKRYLSKKDNFDATHTITTLARKNRGGAACVGARFRALDGHHASVSEPIGAWDAARAEGEPAVRGIVWAGGNRRDGVVGPHDERRAV